MHHHNENPQCYRVHTIEGESEGISPKESSLFPFEYAMVNFINKVEEGHNKEVKKYKR